MNKLESMLEILQTDTKQGTVTPTEIGDNILNIMGEPPQQSFTTSILPFLSPWIPHFIPHKSDWGYLNTIIFYCVIMIKSFQAEWVIHEQMAGKAQKYC